MPCLITSLSELNEARYMTPGGIFDAYEKEIKIITRADVDVDDNFLGLKGSPTNVAQSFPKQLKPAGVKETGLAAADAADYIFGKLKEKYVI